MEQLNHQGYFLTINDLDICLDSLDDVKGRVFKEIKEECGSITLCANDGLRPWWQRFVFGEKYYVRTYFIIEWANEYAGLIFHDENTSEYRAIPKEKLSDIPMEILKKISFGEFLSLDPKYCLTKSESLKAIEEFFSSSKKPSWLEYEFVE